MIFKAKPVENNLIQEAYDEGVEVFSNFFNLKPVGFKPDVFILDNREDIDKVKGKKTDSWVVGWATGNSLFVLNYDNIDTESRHRKSEKDYQSLIKHELCHIFTRIYSNQTILPMWLNEGVSIYLSGQLGMNKKPEVFKGFLESSLENHKPAYIEGGYVVELLISLFGKRKLLDWIRDYKNTKFKDIYGFDLTYENINTLYHGQELSKNEAIEKLVGIVDKPLDFKVKHDGTIEIKSQNYLLSIERKWDLWGAGGEFHSFNFVSLKDEERIEKYVGKSKIIGIDIDNRGIFTFFFEGDKQLAITEGGRDSGFYFKLFSFKADEPTVALTSDFKFILLLGNLK